MTTIKEFIEYLNQLPRDTEISVIITYDCGYSTCAKEVPLDIDPVTGNVEFIDLTDNKFAQEDRAVKSYLTLGQK